MSQTALRNAYEFRGRLLAGGLETQEEHVSSPDRRVLCRTPLELMLPGAQVAAIDLA
jgi:hypothetical protein